MFDDDCEPSFGSGDLTFYRTKLCSQYLVRIEFSEIYPVEPTQEL